MLFCYFYVVCVPCSPSPVYHNPNVVLHCPDSSRPCQSYVIELDGWSVDGARIYGRRKVCSLYKDLNERTDCFNKYRLDMSYYGHFNYEKFNRFN